MTDVIPLPDHLLTCGCPAAESGQHLSICQPARDHDADLDKYKGHPEGTRFQGIRWDFPLRIRANVSYEVELDPGLFIEQHRQEYDQYELEPGFQAWEKPMAFIASLIEEDIDGILGGWFGHPRHVSRVNVLCDDITERPQWTAEIAAQHFPEQSAPTIDPNQGDLFS